jgi:riboflavin synthase
MFTGLVRERGRLSADPEASPQGGHRLRLATSPELLGELAPGASLAVAGVCLTVVELAGGECVVELSPETLARTRLGELRRGDEVNLEPALRMGDPLGGHWVQGHVDATVEVLSVRALGDHREVVIALPREQASLVVEKGSVTLDGVSLTVTFAAEDRFGVSLIPHTLAVTTLGTVTAGDPLHLELDVLGKYVQRALAARGLG